MNDPFDWKNYKPQINMRDIEIFSRISYQKSAHINKQREQGIEPRPLTLPGSLDVPPKTLAVKMPMRPTANDPEERKARYRAKKDASK